MFFQPAGLARLATETAPRRRTWSLADREVVAALGEGPMTPIGLIDRDWRHEIPFDPRRVRPRHLGRLGGGELTDEQASALAETLEGRKREVRGLDTVASRAPQVAEAARKGRAA